MTINELNRRVIMPADKINYVIFSKHYERCVSITVDHTEKNEKQLCDAIMKVHKYRNAEVSTVTAVAESVFRISAISEEL